MFIAKNRRPKAALVVRAIAIVALVVGLIFLGKSLFGIFSDSERIQSLVTDAGAWGPVVFIALQVLQVLFAPIPGQVTGFAGGYLFGTFWGVVYSMIGATIGFTLIFMLARKLGRPFVERFVDKKHLDKFDYLTETKGVFILFLIFLLPAFPDDIIGYIAGLTCIPIRKLILISLAGRLPGYLVLSFSGSGAANNNIEVVAIIFGITMAISAIAYWQRSRLEEFVKRFAGKKNQQPPTKNKKPD